jgi:hypothetical protein
MKSVVEEDGELSHWYVWSVIQYLDPESRSRNRDKPMLVAVIAFVVWIIFLIAMFSLIARTGSTRPGLSFISMAISESQSWPARKSPRSLSVLGELRTALLEGAPTETVNPRKRRHKDVMESDVSELITYG